MMIPRDPHEPDLARGQDDGATVADLRSELEVLRERERQIVELLGSTSADRILHDLRNLLNELQLLRIIASDNNA